MPAAAVAIVLSAVAGLAGPDPAVRAARIDAALRVAERNAPRADSATPGEVLHWIIAFGPDARLPDPRTGGTVSALGRLSDMTYNGAPAFLEVPGGIAAPTSEGHRDQMLAKLGRAGVPLSHPVMAGGRRHTLADLLSAAMRAASTDGEVSWTLLAMCAHLPIDAEWKTASGRTMDIPTLLEAELRSDPPRAACGGCHGLHAVAFALQRARIAGVPVRGVWRRAQDRIDEYVRRAREARNPDGSFSEDWFAVPPTPPRDDAWLIHTTGHVLEWLLLTLDDQAVRQEWIGRAADALADAVIRHDDKPLGKTSLAHAAHALLLYRQRVIDARRR